VCSSQLGVYRLGFVRAPFSIPFEREPRGVATRPKCLDRVRSEIRSGPYEREEWSHIGLVGVGQNARSPRRPGCDRRRRTASRRSGCVHGRKRRANRPPALTARHLGRRVRTLHYDRLRGMTSPGRKRPGRGETRSMAVPRYVERRGVVVHALGASTWCNGTRGRPTFVCFIARESSTLASRRSRGDRGGKR